MGRFEQNIRKRLFRASAGDAPDLGDFAELMVRLDKAKNGQSKPKKFLLWFSLPAAFAITFFSSYWISKNYQLESAKNLYNSKVIPESEFSNTHITPDLMAFDLSFPKMMNAPSSRKKGTIYPVVSSIGIENPLNESAPNIPVKLEKFTVLDKKIPSFVSINAPIQDNFKGYSPASRKVPAPAFSKMSPYLSLGIIYLGKYEMVNSLTQIRQSGLGITTEGGFIFQPGRYAISGGLGMIVSSIPVEVSIQSTVEDSFPVYVGGVIVGWGRNQPHDTILHYRKTNQSLGMTIPLHFEWLPFGKNSRLSVGAGVMAYLPQIWTEPKYKLFSQMVSNGERKNVMLLPEASVGYRLNKSHTRDWQIIVRVSGYKNNNSNQYQIGASLRYRFSK